MGVNNEMASFNAEAKYKKWQKKFGAEWEYLLCLDCEILFKGWEEYGYEVFYGDSNMSNIQRRIVKRCNASFFEISNVDYVKFKLFMLSILWRMGVSGRDMFKHLHLGPHEEKVRKMILANDPGNVDEYPFVIENFTGHARIRKSFIHPQKVRVHGGHVAYVFMINGYFIKYYISKQGVSNELKEALKEFQNKLVTPIASNSREREMVEILNSGFQNSMNY